MPGFNVQIISDTATPMLKKLSADMQSVIVDMLEEGGQQMEDLARTIVPVDTGYLQSTIYYSVDPSTLTLELGAEADYALYVEFGTRRMAAEPFIRPALDSCQDGLSQALLDAILKDVQ